MYSPKLIEAKIRNFIKAWETLRPASSFSGLTLEQFKTQVAPSLSTREELTKLDKQLLKEVNSRDAADQTSVALMKRLVNAIKGDPAEGEDGDLYEAVGYVRASERKSGLHRNKVVSLTKAA